VYETRNQTYIALADAVHVRDRGFEIVWVRTGSDYAVGYILDYSRIAAKANRVVLGAGPIRGRHDARHPTSRYRRIIASQSVDGVIHDE